VFLREKDLSIEVKEMRKAFLFTILLAGVLMFAPAMSQACDYFGCTPPVIPIAGSAEAQAFENLTIEYGQNAGVQNINQVTFKTENVESYEINGNVYGSIHSNPDTLFFVGLKGDLTITDSASTSVSCVTAKVNTMSGNIAMAGDAGASAASTGFAGASSDAGNSGTLTQTQFLKFEQGGFGVQTATVSGYTNVNANAGR